MLFWTYTMIYWRRYVYDWSLISHKPSLFCVFYLSFSIIFTVVTQMCMTSVR